MIEPVKSIEESIEQPFEAFVTSLPTVFAEAQLSQVFKWLLSIELYAVVAGLLLLSLVLPYSRAKKIAGVNLAQDYFYGVFHTLVTFPLLAIVLLLLKYISDRWLPWMNLELYQYIPVAGQIVLAALLNDLLNFISHYLRHKIRPLWHFHTIHHSQQELNPFTTKRTHIVENLFSICCIKWIPLAVMGSPAEVWLLYFLFDAVWDYFIHSNVRLPFGPLKYLVTTPQYHRLHHSSHPDHYNKNFADRFPLWDILFGTADFNYNHVPATGVPGVPLELEKSALPWKLASTFGKQWIYPFKMIAADWKKSRLKDPDLAS